LAGVVDTHFDHGRLMVCSQSKQRLGDTNAVIEIALGFEDASAFGQDDGHHVLGGRFPIAASHGNDRDVKAAAVMGGQLLKSDERIRHEQQEWGLLKGLHPRPPGDDCADCPLLEGGMYEGMAVVTLSRKRDKEIAGKNVARVRRHPQHLLAKAARFHRLKHSRPDDFQDLIDGKQGHIFPFRLLCMADSGTPSCA
jgi:hypothetical protein